MALVPESERLAKPSGLDPWLLHAPSAHPAWSWYWLTGCALRDFPDMPTAVITRDGATHEMMIWAIHPDCTPDPDAITAQRLSLLRPPNLVHQLVDITDEVAKKVMRMFVHAICDGNASPDSDFMQMNARMIDAAAAHFAHPRQGAPS